MWTRRASRAPVSTQQLSGWTIVSKYFVVSNIHWRYIVSHLKCVYLQGNQTHMMIEFLLYLPFYQGEVYFISRWFYSSVYHEFILFQRSFISHEISVLIYNLPETIRESDISKLSFAVELASGLYDRFSDGDHDGPKSPFVTNQALQLRGRSFEPGSLLWLIQRDFLQVRCH